MSRTFHPRRYRTGWPRGRGSYRVWERQNGAGEYARRRNRKERRQANVDLAMGREPFPHQPRSRAKWDAW